MTTATGARLFQADLLSDLSLLTSSASSSSQKSSPFLELGNTLLSSQLLVPNGCDDEGVDDLTRDYLALSRYNSSGIGQEGGKALDELQRRVATLQSSLEANCVKLEEATSNLLRSLSLQ